MCEANGSLAIATTCPRCTFPLALQNTSCRLTMPEQKTSLRSSPIKKPSPRRTPLDS